MSVSIIGTSHSKVGKLTEETIYSLLVDAGREAMKDANLTGKDTHSQAYMQSMLKAT